MTLKNKNILSEFFSGFGQILDVGGLYGENIENKYLNTSGIKLDHDALLSDWQAVGNDIRCAMDRYDATEK